MAIPWRFTKSRSVVRYDTCVYMPPVFIRLLFVLFLFLPCPSHFAFEIQAQWCFCWSSQALPWIGRVTFTFNETALEAFPFESWSPTGVQNLAIMVYDLNDSSGLS